jgi:PAS domain-containing protein
MQTTFVAILMIAAAFIVAFSALAGMAMIDRRKTSRLRRFSEAERDSIVFIFENETLLDATPAARQLLDTAPRNGTVWAHLGTLLGPRFPRLTDWIKDLADLGEMELKSTDGTSRLKAEWHDGVARITLMSNDGADAAAGIDQQSYLAMSQELESLRATAAHTPHPLWRETASGHVTWCNLAYLDLAERSAGGNNVQSWPPAPVFALNESTLQASGEGRAPDLHRIAITPSGSDTRHWFEISVSTLPDGDRFFSAQPTDRLVKAESALREFITTLTKTFASLPIGLAIFDRSRELAVFNPALMDLTSLPAEFLISKPNLATVLDRLREARMMPEPKDYKSWRQQISDLVVAAENGSYEEKWSLPTGQTYRVTGRPHPDGAVALLFEDISAEISLSRRFRTELETGQAALDALPQAIAVFTTGGVLSMANTAYAQLWGRDPSTSLDDMTLSEALGGWRTACAPSPVWDQLRAFVMKPGHRTAWSARIVLTDGRALSCQVSPLISGATMVAFTEPDLSTATGADHAPLRAEPLAQLGAGA